MELYNLYKMNHPMFEIRPYNKAELALLYNPHATQESALKTLYRWINACPLLVEELRSLRYNPRRHVFLRPEVEAIVRFLGEPLESCAIDNPFLRSRRNASVNISIRIFLLINNFFYNLPSFISRVSRVLDHNFN